MVHHQTRDWEGLQGSNQTFWYDTWIVIYENETGHREMVMHSRRQGVVVYGSFLAAWVILINLILGLAILYKKRYTSYRALNWHVLNFLFAELLTGAFVIPLNVKTEKDGYWGFDWRTCRAWLLAQVFLATLTIWAALMATIDRFIYVLQPYSYSNRMTRGRTLAMLVLSWLVSIATIIPPAVAMYQDPTTVLEEVCAISMTRQYAFGISFAAFFAPAIMICFVTMAIMVVAMQAKNRGAQPLGQSDTRSVDSNHKCCPDNTYIAYSEFRNIGNTVGAMVAVNVACVTLWAPFYVVNIMLPFCNGMCVNPSLWSIFLWLGYTSAGVVPILWFLDFQVRLNFKNMLPCLRDDTSYPPDEDNKCAPEDEVTLFKPNTGKEYTL